MPNTYTVDTLTTVEIDQVTGLLDEPNAFPPLSGYFLTITPQPGRDISARFFKMGTSTIPMSLSLQGVGDSQTQWPSKLEWAVTGTVGNSMPLYKVVFQDSENLINDVNWNGGGTNQVYVWIYFGQPGITSVGNLPGTIPITSAVNFNWTLDIDFDIDYITLNDTLVSGGGPSIPVINNFNI
jgi:hypothetical protein